MGTRSAAIAFALLMACRLATISAARHRLSTGVDKTNFSEEATKIKIDGFLSIITKPPGDIQKEMMKEVGGMDFRANVPQQLASLGIKFFGEVIGAVNPILGTMFSIFTNLFGFGDNSNQDLVQSILDKVEKMIKDSLYEFKYDDMRTKVQTAINHVRMAGNQTSDWENMHHYMNPAFNGVFAPCYSGTTEKCNNWKNSTTSGAALLLEIQFADLLIASAVTIREHCLYHAFKAIVNEQLVHASKLIDEHAADFRIYRLDQLQKGKTEKCGVNICTEPSKDLAEDEDFCDFPDTRLWRRYASEIKSTRREKVDTCFKEYQEKVSLEIDELDARAAEVRLITKKFQRVLLRLTNRGMTSFKC